MSSRDHFALPPFTTGSDAAPRPSHRAPLQHGADATGRHPLPELKPPPPEEAIDPTRLLPYLAARLPGADATPQIWRFTGGHANLTYLLRYPGGAEYILRRPPLGPVPPGAHDMAREHRVLSRLHEAYPLAPRSHLFCDNPALIGAPFLIAERRHGITLPGADLPPELAADPSFARRLSRSLIESLAALHRVDPAPIGLSTLGTPENFVLRQLAGWTKRWHAALDHPRPETETLLKWFANNLPTSSRTTLLHNDYKLDNLLLSAPGSGNDPATPVAVLDWDMCTRGDPLMDLAYLLNYWAEPTDPPEWIAASAMPTHHPSFLTRAEAIARYADATGFEIGELRWYRAFAVFKLAVILQQIYIRYLRGQTTDPRFANFAARVDILLQKAETLAQ